MLRQQSFCQRGFLCYDADSVVLPWAARQKTNLCLSASRKRKPSFATHSGRRKKASHTDGLLHLGHHRAHACADAQHLVAQRAVPSGVRALSSIRCVCSIALSLFGFARLASAALVRCSATSLRSRSARAKASKSSMRPVKASSLSYEPTMAMTLSLNLSAFVPKLRPSRATLRLERHHPGGSAVPEPILHLLCRRVKSSTLRLRR